MKNSAQISTFLVLVAALIGVGVLVNRQTIDTSVRTQAESVLPLSYTAPDSGDIVGFTVRYPREWTLTDGGASQLTLNRPVNLNNRQGDQYQFDVTFDTSSEVDDPLAYLGAGQATQFSQFDAAESTSFTQQGVNYHTALLVADGVFLRVASQTPIPESDWGKVKSELEQILNAVEIGEDFAVLAPAFTYSIPDSWGLANVEKWTFTTYTPNDGSPHAVLQLGVFSPDVAADVLKTVVLLPADADASEVTDPFELLGLLEGAESVEGGELIQALTPASYLNMEGQEVGFQTAGTSYFISVLDSEDGYNVVLVRATMLQDNQEALFAEMDSIIETVQYQTPNASIFPSQN